MSKNITVYQTLRNEKPRHVESQGPFICNWSNAWLGTGYYVWEAFLNSAHWWGKARLNGEYFVCEAFCVLNDDNCFDLVGNTAHMQIFCDAMDDLKASGIITHKTTVPRILEFLRTDTGLFKYEATRAVGFTSIGKNTHPEHIKQILFEPKQYRKPEHYLHYMPPIQICLYSKTALGLNGFHIIFPYEYNNDYVL